MIKKYCKKLIKYYDKELKKCHRINFCSLTNNLDYFYTYLKFMRDYYILNATQLDLNKNPKLASICAAVLEYENYFSCINNYYDLSTNVPIQRDTTLSEETIQERFNAEKTLHWNTFWALVATNIENWFTKYEFDI